MSKDAMSEDQEHLPADLMPHPITGTYEEGVTNIQVGFETKNMQRPKDAGALKENTLSEESVCNKDGVTKNCGKQEGGEINGGCLEAKRVN